MRIERLPKGRDENGMGRARGKKRRKRKSFGVKGKKQVLMRGLVLGRGWFCNRKEGVEI